MLEIQPQMYRLTKGGHFVGFARRETLFVPAGGSTWRPDAIQFDKAIPVALANTFQYPQMCPGLAVRRRPPARVGQDQRRRIIEATVRFFQEHPQASWVQAFAEVESPYKDARSFYAALRRQVPNGQKRLGRRSGSCQAMGGMNAREDSE